MKVPFFQLNTTLTLLRILVGIIFLSHGVIRVYANTVSGFGGFLESNGFPYGVALAWSITLFELICGPLLAMGRKPRLIALGFIIHQIMGIVLVHFKNGWYVVGHSTGGMEYSVLLIAALFVIAAKD